MAVWVYGALGWPLAVVITLAVIAYATWFDFAFVSVLPLDQAIAWRLLVQFIVTLIAIFCGFYLYPALVGILIWRAARTYPGPRIWRLLSYAVAAAFLLICGYEISVTHIQIRPNGFHIGAQPSTTTPQRYLFPWSGRV